MYFGLFSYRALNSVNVEQYLFNVNVNSVTLKTYGIMLIPKKISDNFLFELGVHVTQHQNLCFKDSLL